MVLLAGAMGGWRGERPRAVRVVRIVGESPVGQFVAGREVLQPDRCLQTPNIKRLSRVVCSSGLLSRQAMDELTLRIFHIWKGTRKKFTH